MAGAEVVLRGSLVMCLLPGSHHLEGKQEAEGSCEGTGVNYRVAWLLPEDLGTRAKGTLVFEMGLRAVGLQQLPATGNKT